MWKENIAAYNNIHNVASKVLGKQELKKKETKIALKGIRRSYNEDPYKEEKKRKI